MKLCELGWADTRTLRFLLIFWVEVIQITKDFHGTHCRFLMPLHWATWGSTRDIAYACYNWYIKLLVRRLLSERYIGSCVGMVSTSHAAFFLLCSMVSLLGYCRTLVCMPLFTSSPWFAQCFISFSIAILHFVQLMGCRILFQVDQYHYLLLCYRKYCSAYLSWETLVMTAFRTLKSENGARQAVSPPKRNRLSFFST